LRQEKNESGGHHSLFCSLLTDLKNGIAESISLGQLITTSPRLHGRTRLSLRGSYHFHPGRADKADDTYPAAADGEELEGQRRMLGQVPNLRQIGSLTEVAVEDVETALQATDHRSLTKLAVAAAAGDTGRNPSEVASVEE
jgi:hypothetical protein